MTIIGVIVLLAFMALAWIATSPARELASEDAAEQTSQGCPAAPHYFCNASPSCIA